MRLASMSTVQVRAYSCITHAQNPSGSKCELFSLICRQFWNVHNIQRIVRTSPHVPKLVQHSARIRKSDNLLALPRIVTRRQVFGLIVYAQTLVTFMELQTNTV